MLPSDHNTSAAVDWSNFFATGLIQCMHCPAILSMTTECSNQADRNQVIMGYGNPFGDKQTTHLDVNSCQICDPIMWTPTSQEIYTFTQQSISNKSNSVSLSWVTDENLPEPIMPDQLPLSSSTSKPTIEIERRVRELDAENSTYLKPTGAFADKSTQTPPYISDCPLPLICQPMVDINHDNWINTDHNVLQEDYRF